MKQKGKNEDIINYLMLFVMNQVISSLLKILTGLFAITLLSCVERGNSLEPFDSRTGKPFIFRFEISAERPDLFNVNWGGGNYFDGLGRITSFVNPETVSSPCIKEIEIPRNFLNMIAIVTISPIDYPESIEGILTGKVYVNDKLLYTYSAKDIWEVSVAYNYSKKNYTLTNSLDEKIVFEKID